MLALFGYARTRVCAATCRDPWCDWCHRILTLLRSCHVRLLLPHCSFLGHRHFTLRCLLSGSALTDWSALLCFCLLHQPGCYLFCGLCPCGFLLLYRHLGTRTTELKWTWSFDEFRQSLCTRVLMYSKLELLRRGLSLYKLLLPLMTTTDVFNSCHLLHRILVRCGCRSRSLVKRNQ